MGKVCCRHGVARSIQRLVRRSRRHAIHRRPGRIRAHTPIGGAVAKAAPAPVPAKPKSIVKREPAVILTGVATLIATAVFVAPSIGLEIPDTVQKVVAAGVTDIDGFGIPPDVSPVNRWGAGF